MTDLTLQRRLAAAPDKVFAFVTQTEHLLKWWGPEELHVPEHALDLSAIGPWMSVMQNSEGMRLKVSGQVIEVEPGQHVSFTWAWHDEDDTRGHESTVTLSVAADGDGTMLTLHQANLPDDEAGANHEKGWTSSFNKLERLAA